jgi:hypothetical protein
VVLVTHDLSLAGRAGRMIRLADGIVVEDREHDRGNRELGTGNGERPPATDRGRATVPGSPFPVPDGEIA